MQSNEVKWLPLKSLQPNTGQVPGLPGNPRQWTEGDIKRIARSLKETPELFVARPIIVLPYSTPGADDCYVILGGNLRSEGARRNKMETVPCYILPSETPVDKLKEIVIKDNGSFGAWDYDALGNEWSDLPLPEWGVPAWDVQQETEEKNDDVSEDDFDAGEEAIENRCKPGDIWQLGEHRLICADSTQGRTFDLLMDGKEARLCVTSPPYGVGKDYEQKGIAPWEKTIYGVIDQITKHARIIVWNIGDLFATGTQFIEPTSMYSTWRMKENGFPLMYIRIWKKQGGNFAGTNPYYTVSMKPVQEYEWLLCYAKGDYEKDYRPIIDWFSKQAKIAGLNNQILKEITGAGFMFGHWFTSHQFSIMDEANYNKVKKYCAQHSIAAFERSYDDIRREYDDLNIFAKLLPKEEESAWGQWAIWDISTVNKRTGGHPAEFPVELPARFIKMHTRPGDIILEPFCGAGTTMIAAEQLGRVCYGVELDPHYCDIILARWEKLTDRKAQKIE